MVLNEQSKTGKIGRGYGGGTKNRKICDFDLYLLNIDIINDYVVARGGIEPPTHGFSVHHFVISPINLAGCRTDLVVCK